MTDEVTTPTIADCQARRAELTASDSAALDVDLLLGHVLERSRAYLYAHPERRLSPDQVNAFEALMARRRAGEPIAHLVGHAEFWSLPLAVSAATLIPRPDTECLVEWLLELTRPDSELEVVDLGTGTGAIALALASERPRWRITAVDDNVDAVTLARANARDLALSRAALARVRILRSDWFSALGDERFDIVVANPPYIEIGDPHLDEGDVRFEPDSALVAGVEGLDAIRHIIARARWHLVDGGLLLLEHGYRQAEAVAALLRTAGYTGIEMRRDYGGNPRATLGVYREHA